MNYHNLKMVAGLVIIGIIGALQAIHGNIVDGGWIDAVVSILLIVEHTLAGNTATPAK